MYQLKWNADDQMQQLSNLVDEIDDKTLLEVYIERYKVYYYRANLNNYVPKNYVLFSQPKNTRLLK